MMEGAEKKNTGNFHFLEMKIRSKIVGATPGVRKYEILEDYYGE